MKTKNIATFFAVLAAALYAIHIPFSKLLLTQVQPTMMAAFLYLGAGLGLLIYGLLRKEKEQGEPLTKAELPCAIGMIVLDIAAPVLLMLGLERTNSANASLLNNFEIVAASMIALLVFKEVLSKRLTIAIALQHTHVHSHIHNHEHKHGDLVHSHEHEHLHSHTHIHGEDESAHGHDHERIDGHNHIHNERKDR